MKANYKIISDKAGTYQLDVEKQIDRERILLLFNSVLDENPPKDADYYRSQGFEIEKDEELPWEPEYIPKDTPYKNHEAAINTLFLDILGLVKEGKLLNAFNAYALMIRESAKILKKIDLDDYEIDPEFDLEIELIELFQNLSKECRLGIIKLLKIEDNNKFASKVIKWLQKEMVLEVYRHHRHYITLSELFNDLSNSSSNFKVLADDFVRASVSPQKEPVEFLKISYHCNNGNFDAAQKIIAANQMKYELDKFFIEHLHTTGKKYKAIAMAKESHNSAKAATHGCYKLSLEERAARYNLEDLNSAYDFILWSENFVLDTLLELKDYDQAIDYVYNRYTKEGAKGLDYYAKLNRALPKERTGELAKRIFRALDQLSVYTVRDICIYENFWLPLIDSFKIKAKLYDVLRIYESNKDQLIIFPEEMAEMFYSVISQYIENESSAKKLEIVKIGLFELSLIKDSEHVLYSLLLHLKTRYRKRKILQHFLEEFILENNIKEEYDRYEIKNAI